jgi:hypothetical protein
VAERYFTFRAVLQAAYLVSFHTVSKLSSGLVVVPGGVKPGIQAGISKRRSRKFMEVFLALTPNKLLAYT